VCDQRHSSRVSTFLTSSHSKLRPNIEGATSSWQPFAPCADPAHCLPVWPGSGIPRTPTNTCSAVAVGENLVYSLPASTYLAGVVDTALACRVLCNADPACNFWTWHDVTNGPVWANKCYARNDTVYAPVSEAGHVSGICNHTLPPGAAEEGGGVHGLSVGSRVLDFIPTTTAQKVRFRCTSSLASDGTAFIHSFSVHAGAPPTS
jgi:hypothetical protein